jgi:hypothetical protein
MDFTGNEFEDIAKVVAAIVGLALVLQTALGNQIMLITEALKSAFHVKNGSGGILAIGVSVFACVALALVTAILAVDTGFVGYVAFIAIGAVVGLFVGSGAVSAHKTAGAVNTVTSTAIQNEKEYRAEKAADEARESARIGDARLMQTFAAAAPRPMTTPNGDGTFTHTFTGAPKTSPQVQDMQLKISADTAEFDKSMAKLTETLQELSDERAVVDNPEFLREKIETAVIRDVDFREDVDDLSQVAAAQRDQLNDKLLMRGQPSGSSNPPANAV